MKRKKQLDDLQNIKNKIEIFAVTEKTQKQRSKNIEEIKSKIKTDFLIYIIFAFLVWTPLTLSYFFSIISRETFFGFFIFSLIVFFSAAISDIVINLFEILKLKKEEFKIKKNFLEGK